MLADLLEISRHDAGVADLSAASLDVRSCVDSAMAQAVQAEVPGTKLGIGPAIENGFYFDFQTDEPFTASADLGDYGLGQGVGSRARRRRRGKASRDDDE